MKVVRAVFPLYSSLLLITEFTEKLKTKFNNAHTCKIGKTIKLLTHMKSEQYVGTIHLQYIGGYAIINTENTINKRREDTVLPIGLIDERVAPYLGKATTRVLVQGAARSNADAYPFLTCLINRPYTHIIPSMIHEHVHGVTLSELTEGLNALLDACFAGLRELTGDLIAPPLHEEVVHQLRQLQ
jgi:hypothetical protein